MISIIIVLTVSQQAGTYQCRDKNEVSISVVCDRHSDCPDSSDEDWCTPVEAHNVTQDFLQAYGEPSNSL